MPSEGHEADIGFSATADARGFTGKSGVQTV
jgi:hypothetical protein